MNVLGSLNEKCPCCGSEIVEIVLKKRQIITTQTKFQNPVDVPHSMLELSFCHNCTILFVTNNILNVQENLFGKLYETSLTSISENEIVATSQTIEILKNYTNGGNVLEIGSGQGDFLNQLERNGFEVNGCEPGNSYFISKSKYPHIEVKHNIFEPTEYQVKAYDIIVFQNCLEHIPNPRDIMVGVWNILKDNGILFIQVPNFEYSLLNDIYSDIYFEHLLYFGKDSLEFFLHSTHFNILHHEFLNGGRDQLIIANKRLDDSSHTEDISNDLNKKFTDKTNQFVGNYNKYYNKVDNFIDELNQTRRKIIVYGAGITLLSNFSLTEKGLSFLKRIVILIDGDENKHGYYLPIVPVPIKSPKILTQITNPADFCILICAEKYRYEIYDNIITEFGEKVKDVLIYSMFPDFDKMTGQN